MKKYIVFQVDGGIGKNIMATSVVKAIKSKYSDRKIIVVSAWPGVWVNNPNVYRFYPHDKLLYFYDDYIKECDVKIFKFEPYHHEDYILKKRHLIDIWCEQCNVKYNNESPELYYSWREEQYVINKLQVDGRPIVLIQTNGGSTDYTKYSWVRDIPIHIAQEVVNILNTLDVRVIHLRKEGQFELNNCEQYQTDNIRDLFGLIKIADKLLAIDSYSQHVAKAFNKSSVVCWPIDNCSVLGYDLHTNIISSEHKKFHHLADSYLGDYNIFGTLHECPFETNNIFNTREIVDAISK